LIAVESDNESDTINVRCNDSTMLYITCSIEIYSIAKYDKTY